MELLIIMTTVAGFVIFGLGVISARNARKQRQTHKRSATTSLAQSAKKNVRSASTGSSAAMSMVAHGVGNGGDEFATVGNHPR